MGIGEAIAVTAIVCNIVICVTFLVFKGYTTAALQILVPLTSIAGTAIAAILHKKAAPATEPEPPAGGSGG